MSTSIINYNGELIAESAFNLSANNRSFRYGDGLFESMRCENGKILFWEDHYFRAMGSMCMLRMDIPSKLNMDYLHDLVLDTVKANGLSESSCRIRINFWRKDGGLYTPTNRSVNFLVECEALDSVAFDIKQDGLSADIYFDHKKAKSDLSTIKSNNGILYVLASIFAEESDLDQVFIQNTDQHVIESQNSNLFVIKDNVIITPDVKEGCLDGIMRKQILKIAEVLKIEVKNDPIRNYELSSADEIWVSNAVSGLQFVSKYKNKEYKASMMETFVEELKQLAFNS